jgi:hypothetical protein
MDDETKSLSYLISPNSKNIRTLNQKLHRVGQGSGHTIYHEQKRIGKTISYAAVVRQTTGAARSGNNAGDKHLIN